jgi:hypothetical protein
MIDKSKILADRQGRKFKAVVTDPAAPVQLFIDVVNARAEWLSFVTIQLDEAALGAIVREFEQLDEVKQFFIGTTPRAAWRFKQLMGVIVKLKMEEDGLFVTTGQKGYLPNSRWLIKSEIYQPTPRHPQYRLWKSAQKVAAAA